MFQKPKKFLNFKNPTLKNFSKYNFFFCLHHSRKIKNSKNPSKTNKIFFFSKKMFVYLKQGLALKKKDSLQIDPLPQPNPHYLLCPKPDHQENPLNIVCYDAHCPKRGLLCSCCFFQDHSSHNSLCCSLKDFLKNYQTFILKEKETSQKEVKEEDSEALRVSFEGMSRMILASKQRYEEQYNRLEAALKQKELFLTNSLQNKNISDTLDLINNMSQGSINTVNGYMDAMNYLLEGLSGSVANGFKDEKLKQDLMPNGQILEKVRGLRNGLEGELQRLDAFYSKITRNCQDLLLEKAVAKHNGGNNALLGNELEAFISEVIGKNVRVSSFVRIFKGTEDGFKGGFLEKRLEGKQGVLSLIRADGVFLGVYFEGFEVNRKYVVFCAKEKRKVKEGRIWGNCQCKDKEKMVFTSSNLHEIVVWEEGNQREDNFWEEGKQVVRFKAKEIEVYEIV